MLSLPNLAVAIPVFAGGALAWARDQPAEREATLCPGRRCQPNGTWAWRGNITQRLSLLFERV